MEDNGKFVKIMFFDKDNKDLGFSIDSELCDEHFRELRLHCDQILIQSDCCLKRIDRFQHLFRKDD